ncbi:MAG TPA: hypothetical protein VKR61_00885 [Bryobacteraceae bacterium]|nr:hypothetical protein [Bryobacteraceae bacterium]
MARSQFAGLAALILIAACGWLQGQIRTSLNGVWKMDPAKSDFGGGPVSDSRLDRIGIEGSTLKDTITQKLHGAPESTYDMIYTLDGKECTNHVRGNLVESTAQWEGEALFVDSKVHTLRMAILKDRYTVSPDGKTLTLLRHMSGARNAEQKIVFDRQ